MISVDDSEFHTEYEDERLGTETFKICIQLYGDETDGFKLINPPKCQNNDDAIDAFVNETL